mmetsp:Transcript_128728/g.181600  ORF Transcript_128728/g.181600 Transcript_128728/m.181600 type:complete len:331 (-) Transcript_128728:402-1394(-)
MLHFGPSSAIGVRTLGLEDAQVAPELREQHRNCKIFEVLLDLVVRRILEVVGEPITGIGLVTPGVNIEAVHVHGVFLAVQCASQVPRHLPSVSCTHVHVGIDQRHSAHGASARFLIQVHISCEGFDAWERRPSVLVVLGQFVCDRKEEGVVELAEFLHNLLGETQRIHTHVPITFDLLRVAVRGREGWEEAPVFAVQGDDDVDSQRSRLLHELAVVVLGVDIVQPHSIGTKVRYGVQVLAPHSLVLVRNDVLGVGPLTSLRMSRDAVIHPALDLHAAPEGVVVVLVPRVVSHAFGEKALPSNRIIEEVALDNDRMHRLYSGWRGHGPPGR